MPAGIRADPDPKSEGQLRREAAKEQLEAENAAEAGGEEPRLSGTTARESEGGEVGRGSAETAHHEEEGEEAG